jgi:hypothetical protein
VPVKRVQSFEFYGADAQPKPARKGGRAGGGVYPWERTGSVKGGLPHHRWSNGQHLGLTYRRTEVRISAYSKIKFN